jgi:predicted HNH restriction endonuclease
MKGTSNFKKTIEEHLKYRAFTDPLFAKTLEKENKNLDDCITYILTTVKNSGSNGFEDDEIFNMAIHYYDEDDIKITKGSGNIKAVVNHKVHLSLAEIAEAKQKAINQVIADEKARMLKKTVKPVQPVKPDKKESPSTLF